MTGLRSALAAVALMSSQPVAAHDWYTGITNSDGATCCGGTDCQQIPDSRHLRRDPDGRLEIELFPGDLQKMQEMAGPRWFKVLGVPMPSPDGHMHACMTYGDFFAGEVRCFFEGGTM